MEGRTARVGGSRTSGKRSRCRRPFKPA